MAKSPKLPLSPIDFATSFTEDAHVAAAGYAHVAAADDKTRVLSAITALKYRLADFIDPDFGLLDELLSRQVLTRRECANVRSERTVYRRNDALLELLTSEGQCVKFLEALQRTGQQHVVNYVIQNGDIGPEFGDIRPLDEAHMRKLTVNGIQLLDRIDSNVAFVTELADAGCITWPQRDHIINIIQPRDRNDKLLEFITRRSIADFQQFISVLAKEQSHLVPLLVTDGVVVGMDAELDELSVIDVTQCEDRIVSQWEALLPTSFRGRMQDKVDELDELLRPLGMETSLVMIRRANSLALYLICMTLAALMSLRDQWCSRQLRDTVQRLFTLLSGAAVRVKRLRWPLLDYQHCLEFFSSAQNEDDSSKTVTLSVDRSKFSQTFKTLSDLPLEMLETVLMRAFWMLYSSDVEGDDVNHPYVYGKSRSSEHRACALLASVCSSWHLTLTGWPQSPTRNWFRHQLKRLIERSCRPFQRSVAMLYKYVVDVSGPVFGVTQLHDVVYIVWSKSTIFRFNARTHQRLTDIIVTDLKFPWGIVACQQTLQVYIADYQECIWRVSSDGEDIKRWLPKSPSDTFTPWSMSVTSTRLLVTSRRIRQLIQFDAVGDELRRVQLPDDMKPQHAVESPTGTFIISSKTRLGQYQVSEVNTGGEVLRQFSDSRLRSLALTPHIAIDSHGNILVADGYNRCILLLDAHLTLRRVLIDAHQLNYTWPMYLCYTEQSGQLLVGLHSGEVAVFDVHHY